MNEYAENLVNRLSSAFTVYAGRSLNESHLADLCREADIEIRAANKRLALALSELEEKERRIAELESRIADGEWK